MRRLLPSPVTVDLADPYAGLEPPPDWVAIGMVGSIDGATAVDGTSGSLGAAGDLAAFRALRALADVVLVGLGTAVAEQYRATWPARATAARAARGQPPLPRLALVTASGRVPHDVPALADPDRPPLVLTTTSGAAAARERTTGRAEVVELEPDDGGRVPPDAALAALGERGLGRVVCEGGPTLNHAMVAAGVVDELFVTIAPLLVGGRPGLVGEALEAGPRRLVLQELRVHGSELVCRYRFADRSGR